MSLYARRASRSPAWPLALVASLLAHAALVVALTHLGWTRGASERVAVASDAAPSPVRVVAAPDAEPAPPEALAARLPEEIAAEVVESPAEEPPPEQPSPEESPPEEPRPALPSVHQPARDERPPDEARYLAEVDNRAEEETVALETAPPSMQTPAASAPAPAPPRGRPDAESAERIEGDERAREAVAAVAPTPPAPAPSLPRPEREESPESGPLLESLRMETAFQRSREALDARTMGSTTIGSLGGHDEATFAEVFGAEDASAREQAAREAREESLGGDHHAQWERTRAALENYDISVRPGAETNLNTRADVAASYLHHIHNKLHERWRGYLASLDLIGGDPRLLAPDFSVTLEYVIRSDGHVHDVRIWRSSGVLAYDARAVDTFYAIGPHLAPPDGVRSDDGLTYIHWQLHRDNRACGTFNASVRRVVADDSTRPGRSG